MIRIRKAADRGHADHGWLDTHYTFSFADYHEPAHMGFRDLRVLNEDRIAGGTGFPKHGHRDMEILTFMIAGALKHEDSGGNELVLHAGDVQRMSAGSGVMHSEVNASGTEAVHLLQVWILPAENGGTSSYDQLHFPAADRQGKLRPLASPDGKQGSLTLGQDVTVFGTVLDGGQSIEHSIAPGRHAWLQVTAGTVDAGGERLEAGDGMAISDESSLTIMAHGEAEALLFDLR
jgi:redox-sensitive bicupin YhaK (pirin superfamily)